MGGAATVAGGLFQRGGGITVGRRQISPIEINNRRKEAAKTSLSGANEAAREEERGSSALTLSRGFGEGDEDLR